MKASNVTKKNRHGMALCQEKDCRRARDLDVFVLGENAAVGKHGGIAIIERFFRTLRLLLGHRSQCTSTGNSADGVFGKVYWSSDF